MAGSNVDSSFDRITKIVQVHVGVAVSRYTRSLILRFNASSVGGVPKPCR